MTRNVKEDQQQRVLDALMHLHHDMLSLQLSSSISRHDTVDKPHRNPKVASLDWSSSRLKLLKLAVSTSDW